MLSRPCVGSTGAVLTFIVNIVFNCSPARGGAGEDSYKYRFTTSVNCFLYLYKSFKDPI